ncbi:hypothetical protein LUZ60_014776 [Juncus effusus]|nr:hypothetical protein LUZ60_014776 [Juncus effusus]
MAGVRDIKSKAELDEAVNGGKPVVLHFWASWCEASKQMDQIFSHLAADHPHALFYRVEAEEQPEISEAYSVAAVPFFVFCKEGKTVDTLEGANPSALTEKVSKVVGSTPTISTPNVETPPTEGLNANLKSRLDQLVNSSPFFLFMKGTPDEPKCKFSRKVVEILKTEEINFKSFDILADNEVREGMKLFANWPTFPQLFHKGELLGGCDIVISLHESDELKSYKNDSDSDPNSVLEKRLLELINSSPVMVFMKGSPSEPKCGFSNKLIQILKEENIPFNSFDILSDESVREGLKTFSNWPSFPQLYINGELIGGSDIVLEMQKTGELQSLLTQKGIVTTTTTGEEEDNLEKKLTRLTNSSPVMVFMKGSPAQPRCGFSRKVVEALEGEGIEFGTFDILGDEEVRQGLKEFSNWPTFPQVYCKGELVGGCDIVMELKESGELKDTLSE